MTDEHTLSTLVLALEEQENNLKKKCSDLENQLEKQREKVSKLQTALQLEKIKTAVFLDIIKSNTTIKISDLYQENEDGIHFYNFEGGNIPVIVHDLSTVQTYSLSVKKKSEKQPGKSFRTVKNQIELVEENPEVQEQKIKEVEDTMEKVLQENNLDVSYKETIEFIEEIFKEVIKNRVYKKALLKMREYRAKLLGKLNLTNYIKLVKTHINRLEEIFTKKKYDQKKIVSTITLALSPLDQRLLMYGQYYNCAIDADDIQSFRVCLEVNMEHPKRYVPFTQTELCLKLCNYSLCLFTLRETLKRIFINPFGFPNLVYLDIEKSTSEDPYSFYSLEKIDSTGKRHWKMECRLDELSKFISEQIRIYCINLFRKIYSDIFSDNIYREDYLEKAPAAQQDCEQLLQNILILSKPKKFCNILRNVVRKYCNIQASQIDKFNFTRDDPIVRKSFTQEEDDDKTLTEVVRRLFDDISDENAENVWQSR